MRSCVTLLSRLGDFLMSSCMVAVMNWKLEDHCCEVRGRETLSSSTGLLLNTFCRNVFTIRWNKDWATVPKRQEVPLKESIWGFQTKEHCKNCQAWWRWHQAVALGCCTEEETEKTLQLPLKSTAWQLNIWVFQQDDKPAHTSDLVSDWIKEDMTLSKPQSQSC